MDDIQAEKQFYRRQSDELGGRVLQLQEELTRVYNDAMRSRTTTILIKRTYELINHDVGLQQIQKRFLQVVLGAMSVDRAMILRYNQESGVFIPVQFLGFEPNVLSIDPIRLNNSTIPDFIFANSKTKSDPTVHSLREAISVPYLLWTFNSHEGIGLLLGNETEDRVFRLPFEEKDRDVIETSVSVFIDIIKRKEAEKAFIESEGRYRKLVQSSPESILVCYDKNIAFINSAGLKLLGIDNPDTVIDQPIMSFIYSEDHAKVKEIIQKILDEQQETPLTEVSFKRIDGSIVDTEIVAIPFTYQGRSAVQMVAIDVSERKKMQKELIKVQKIESLGVLAGGIAHDFNNILTGILGNIELALAYSNPESDEYRFLNNAHSASNRAKELTQKLLTFSKGGIPLTEPTTLADIISDSVNFVLSGSSIICDFFLPADLWPVDIDVVQFRQVIENLTINANQAMPNGGTFTIKAENVDEDVRKTLPLIEKRYVKLIIQDQGIGISEKHIQNIFDPYFTTKDEGSGLGLATTYSIINKHNGLITVKSEVGKGTVFTIYIPASEGEPLEGKKEKTEPKTGKGKILVMDDDEGVRLVAEQMLSTLGFTTVAACDGKEALEFYQTAMESGESFDVVIIDLTIRGGMGGLETLNRLSDIDPDIKAIVSSGYSNSPVMASYEDYGFSGIIKKPYNMNELSECLFRILSH